MLDPGDQVLVRVSEASNNPTLRLGCVTELRDGVFVVEMAMEELPAAGGDSVLLYFQHAGAFLQQPARIDDVSGQSATPMIAVRALGEPVSAESRQHPRVSTAATELVARIGDAADCPILDVSAAGLAAVSNDLHNVGRIVAVSLDADHAIVQGSACIQNIRELWEGRFRYGLCCIDDPQSVLRRTLERLTAAHLALRQTQ